MENKIFSFAWTFTMSLFLILACSSKNKAVNDIPQPIVLPMAPLGSTEMVQAAIGRTPTDAIEGRLVLQGDLPTPLSNIQIGLYKKSTGSWTELAKLSSGAGGVFAFTQKLSSGTYEVRVLDKTYEGVLRVVLDNSPQRGLILYAKPKDRK